jgi:hypothetical protein
MTYLTPHSKEWFAALDKCNADQAAMTRKIISLAQSADVCGVCGDDPATAYEVLGVSFAKGLPATVRLCDDCKSIRAHIHRERFRPI